MQSGRSIPEKKRKTLKTTFWFNTIKCSTNKWKCHIWLKINKSLSQSINGPNKLSILKDYMYVH